MRTSCDRPKRKTDRQFSFAGWHAWVDRKVCECGQYLSDLYHGWILTRSLCSVTWDFPAWPSPPKASGVWSHSSPANHLMSIVVNHPPQVNYCYTSCFLCPKQTSFVSVVHITWLMQSFFFSWLFLPHNQLAQHAFFFSGLPQLNSSWNSIIIFVPFSLVIEAMECVKVCVFFRPLCSFILSFFALLLCVNLYGYCATMVVKPHTAWAVEANRVAH